MGFLDRSKRHFRTGVTVLGPENCVTDKPNGKLCSSDRERSRGKWATAGENELVGFKVS